MKPDIIYKCSKKYRIDVEKVLNQILNRIPDKYLSDLAEVVLVDKQKENCCRIRYIPAIQGSSRSKIVINMDNIDYSKYPFFSILSLNMDFILMINEHVDRHLKPTSTDPDISFFKRERIKYRWMYFGVWTPLFLVFIIFSFPINRASFLRKNIIKWIK